MIPRTRAESHGILKHVANGSGLLCPAGRSHPLIWNAHAGDRFPEIIECTRRRYPTPCRQRSDRPILIEGHFNEGVVTLEYTPLYQPAAQVCLVRLHYPVDER